MILTGDKILEELTKRRIEISPFSEKQLNPNSYNLTLSDTLIEYDGKEALDLKIKPKGKKITIDHGGILLQPNRLYLGCTNEFTHTDRYVPMLEGRSSIARYGLQIHISAGFGDIGFAGKWTLEIVPTVPVWIYPNTEICQIYFLETLGNRTRSYNGGKYQNSTDIVESRLYLELNK